MVRLTATFGFLAHDLASYAFVHVQVLAVGGLGGWGGGGGSDATDEFSGRGDNLEVHGVLVATISAAPAPHLHAARGADALDRLDHADGHVGDEVCGRTGWSAS